MKYDHTLSVRHYPRLMMDAVADLRLDEEVAYRRLVERIAAGPVPDDDKVLAIWTGAGRRWLRLKALLISKRKIDIFEGKIREVCIAEAIPRQRALDVRPGVWIALRATILARDNHTCRYCGAMGVPMDCDHVQPLARGGRSTVENLVAACIPCNRSKGALDLGEWQASGF